MDLDEEYSSKTWLDEQKKGKLILKIQARIRKDWFFMRQPEV